MSENFSACASVTNRSQRGPGRLRDWLRGRDLNPRPLGYEPNELPDCSTPRQSHYHETRESERQIRDSLVGLGRVELPTSRLSGVRSNQLSYRPLGLLYAILAQKRATLLFCRPNIGGRAGGPCSFGG